jgi:hypothetical protein
LFGAPSRIGWDTCRLDRLRFVSIRRLRRGIAAGFRDVLVGIQSLSPGQTPGSLRGSFVHARSFALVLREGRPLPFPTHVLALRSR